MADTHLSIRLDLANGDRIGPGKIALLEAIRAKGSISAAARQLGMSYRRAWLLVEDMNRMFSKPLVLARPGGAKGGGASLTQVGDSVVALYREAERETRRGASAAIARIEKALAAAQ